MAFSVVKIGKMGKLIVIIVLIGVVIVYVKAQGGNTFFGKDDNSCMSDNSCSRDTNVAASPDSEEGVLDDTVHVDQVGVTTSDDNISTTRGKTYEKAINQDEVNIVITFTNAVLNRKLIETFTVTVQSILERASLPLAIHIIGEEESQRLAGKIIKQNAGRAVYRVGS